MIRIILCSSPSQNNGNHRVSPYANSVPKTACSGKAFHHHRTELRWTSGIYFAWPCHVKETTETLSSDSSIPIIHQTSQHFKQQPRRPDLSHNAAHALTSVCPQQTHSKEAKPVSTQPCWFSSTKQFIGETNPQTHGVMARGPHSVSCCICQGQLRVKNQLEPSPVQPFLPSAITSMESMGIQHLCTQPSTNPGLNQQGQASGGQEQRKRQYYCVITTETLILYTANGKRYLLSPPALDKCCGKENMLFASRTLGSPAIQSSIESQTG